MRTFYPCVHSRDFYRISSADVASRGDRGRSYYRFGVHDDMVLMRRSFDESGSNETPEIFAWNNKSDIQNKIRQGAPCLILLEN